MPYISLRRSRRLKYSKSGKNHRSSCTRTIFQCFLVKRCVHCGNPIFHGSPNPALRLVKTMKYPIVMRNLRVYPFLLNSLEVLASFCGFFGTGCQEHHICTMLHGTCTL